MPQLKVLLTGASGYIGGSILTELLTFDHKLEISALVRSDNHIEAINNLPTSASIKAIKFSGLDDTEWLKRAASDYDVVINAANTMHRPASEALIEGLGTRSKQTGRKTYFIHTSGTSNFGDHPFSGTASTILRSDTDDIYTWEKDNASTWITREVDVAVIDTGEKYGVHTIITNPPLIYGEGTGPIHKTSIQVPALSRLALAEKSAVQIGDGSGLWSVVHISDVARFYALILEHILAGKEFVTGREGYYFLEAGEVSWGQISRATAEAGVSQGLLPNSKVKSMDPERFSQALGISFLNAYMVEVIWGSNARVKGERSRQVGWQPRHGVDDFWSSIPAELQSAVRPSS